MWLILLCSPAHTVALVFLGVALEAPQAPLRLLHWATDLLSTGMWLQNQLSCTHAKCAGRAWYCFSKTPEILNLSGLKGLLLFHSHSTVLRYFDWDAEVCCHFMSSPTRIPRRPLICFCSQNEICLSRVMYKAFCVFVPDAFTIATKLCESYPQLCDVSVVNSFLLRSCSRSALLLKSSPG